MGLLGTRLYSTSINNPHNSCGLAGKTINNLSNSPQIRVPRGLMSTDDQCVVINSIRASSILNVYYDGVPYTLW